MIAVDSTGAVIVCPNRETLGQWPCDGCGDCGTGTATKLPTGWHAFVVPELGAGSEHVLCPTCWASTVEDLDLAVTGDDPGEVHPWGA